ncbi:MAG: patatin-like phospholipase family protein [Flavobacteriales bacterium]|nr:patatin-like phospholipase family protein [Flavobacteriales bacterium]
MLEGPIDLGTVSYLTFEGGGGKGLVYVGAIAALEHMLNPDFKPRFRDSFGVDLGQVPSDLMTLTDRPLYNINLHPSQRPFAGVSGASAGAITALFLAMGMSSLDIDDEINAVEEDGLPIGNPASKVPASRFEQFFDDPLPYLNLTADPIPGEKKHENTFAGDDALAFLIAEAARQGATAEIADAPTLSQITLIRRLLFTQVRREGIDTDHKLYVQSLLANRGLFSLRKVRAYFINVIRRRPDQPIRQLVRNLPGNPG